MPPAGHISATKCHRWRAWSVDYDLKDYVGRQVTLRLLATFVTMLTANVTV